LPANTEETGSLKNKYFTQKLQAKLKNLNLDYDPILKAQDCDKKWLEKLIIIPDKEEQNTYIVSYPDTYNKTDVRIRLSVTKVNRNYLIDDIEID